MFKKLTHVIIYSSSKLYYQLNKLRMWGFFSWRGRKTAQTWISKTSRNEKPDPLPTGPIYVPRETHGAGGFSLLYSKDLQAGVDGHFNSQSSFFFSFCRLITEIVTPATFLPRKKHRWNCNPNNCLRSHSYHWSITGFYLQTARSSKKLWGEWDLLQNAVFCSQQRLILDLWLLVKTVCFEKWEKILSLDYVLSCFENPTVIGVCSVGAN